MPHNGVKEASLFEVVDLLRERQWTGKIMVWAWATLKVGGWVKLDYTAAVNWAIDIALLNSGKVTYRINGENALFLGCGDSLEHWTTPR